MLLLEAELQMWQKTNGENLENLSSCCISKKKGGQNKPSPQHEFFFPENAQIRRFRSGVLHQGFGTNRKALCAFITTGQALATSISRKLVFVDFSNWGSFWRVSSVENGEDSLFQVSGLCRIGIAKVPKRCHARPARLGRSLCDGPPRAGDGAQSGRQGRLA